MPSALDGYVHDAFAVGTEDDSSLQCGGGVIQVDDRPPSTMQRLEGALDEVVASLRQHLDADVIRNHVALDELADEVEVGLARGREPDLDLLVAKTAEELEDPPLARRRHRVDQRLVPVA